jgi:photosynthetic reaction center cytochrome c subunit
MSLARRGGRILVVVGLVGMAAASGDTAQVSGETAPRAEAVFKNVRVLRGISVEQFMSAMSAFSAALGMSCEDCHAADDRTWEGFAVDNPRKETARRMVQMMAAINETHFGGQQLVTCYTCHRGSARPRLTPNLDTLYGAPPPLEVDEVITQARGAPPAKEVLDKYLRALGGAQRLARLSSFVATGISIGYGPESDKRPLEIYARAPAARTVIVHTSSGDATTTFDGQQGWIAAPYRPVPVLAISGQDLEALRLEAQLVFPAQLPQALVNWRVGAPTFVGGRAVDVVQGRTPNGLLATFFFDRDSGLLVRSIRYTDSPVGRIPTQIDYADYREVDGIKIPFRWTVTWLSGEERVELSEVRLNVAVDEARFARPRPPGR